MVISTMNFKSSVNIKFDLENVNFLKRYLPTPSHAEALQGILTGFNTPTNRRAHIIIGPYGTGKSMIGTLLASIVSKNINKKDYNYISDKFTSIDDDIYNELQKFRKQEKRFLPVILNGNEGKFGHSVLSSIQKTLTRNGINIIVPGVVSKIIETVDNWKDNFPKTFRLFKRLLIEERKDLDLWRIEIMAQNTEEIMWFKSIFPNLTSGADFLVDLSDNFIEQIKYILDELNKREIGLFIVYDEFGRYLQSLEYNEINETMQILQDLAELTDHYSDDIHLLLITHKHLRHYFSSFNDEFQNEFQRIEKRFRMYYIDSDSSTFFRITESVLSTMGIKSPNVQGLKDITNQLRKYPLFSQLNQVEIEKLIVKGTFPIHPVTLYILPYLSNLYGQNERTLFTFLESKETNSLLQHITVQEGYYLPYKLFHYFFPNFTDVEFSEKEDIASTYRSIIRKIPDSSINQNNDIGLVEIIQFITLWELCGLQSKIKLTTEFIAFSFNEDVISLREQLTTLEKLKFIRFNRILEYWELFEGSSYNIDDLISEHAHVVEISKEKKLNIISESLTKKYFLAREYNDNKSMTRFASTNLVLSGDILNGTFDPEIVYKEKASDVVINLIIMESKREKERLIEMLHDYKHEFTIYCIHPYALTEIEESIIEKSCLTMLIGNDDIIKNDKNLKKELQVHLEDVTYELNKYMHVFNEFSSALTWIIDNQSLHIKNEIILEGFLTRLMYKHYHLTPEIRNDGYNRRKLNNVQLKAGYKLVNHLIKTPYYEHLGIEGNGPEYLIYAAIFKNNKLNIQQLDDIKNEELKNLRETLLSKLEVQPRGNFSDLISIMTRSPFGIRKPIIPILLISLLRDKWDQILFYNKEMFISQINGEILFSMVNEPEKYEYNFLKLSSEFNSFVSFLEVVFKEYINPVDEKSIKPILVTNAMLKWLRTLPRFVQITRNVNDELVSFKDSIRLTEIDPQKGLQLLFEQFGERPDRIEDFVNELNDSFKHFSKGIVNELFNIIQVDTLHDLKKWVENQNPVLQKQNNLIKSIIANVDYENWIDKVAYDLVGVELTSWSDKTKEMFLVQVQSEYEKLRSYDVELDDSIIINYKDRTKSIRKAKLSTKSLTLYNNVTRILKNGGRNVPKEEIENIVLHLLEDFVE